MLSIDQITFINIFSLIIVKINNSSIENAFLAEMTLTFRSNFQPFHWFSSGQSSYRSDLFKQQSDELNKTTSVDWKKHKIDLKWQQHKYRLAIFIGIKIIWFRRKYKI